MGTAPVAGRAPGHWRISLYLFLPALLEVFEQAPQLEDIQWRWFFLMAALMTGAFVALWELTRIAVPGISWFVASTAQLTSNAAVKLTPGGIVAGGRSTSGCWRRLASP